MKKGILFLLVIALILGGCDLLNKKKKAHELAERLRLDSIAQAQQDSIKLADQLQQARLDSLKAAEAKNKKFYIIAGSFKVSGNAEKYSKKMECEGYKPEVLDYKNGYKLVSVASFDSFNGAKNQVRKIKDEGKYIVWIYHPN